MLTLEIRIFGMGKSSYKRSLGLSKGPVVLNFNRKITISSHDMFLKKAPETMTNQVSMDTLYSHVWYLNTISPN